MFIFDLSPDQITAIKIMGIYIFGFVTGIAALSVLIISREILTAPEEPDLFRFHKVDDSPNDQDDIDQALSIANS